MFGKEVLHELPGYTELRKHSQMIGNMVWSVRYDDLLFLFHTTLPVGQFIGTGNTTHLTSSRVHFRRIIKNISKRNPWNQKQDYRPHPRPFPPI